MMVKVIWQLCRYLFWPQRTDKTRYNECSNDNLKQNITTIIGQEISEGKIEPIPPLYISRMLNVPLEEIEKAMKEMQV